MTSKAATVTCDLAQFLEIRGYADKYLQVARLLANIQVEYERLHDSASLRIANLQPHEMEAKLISLLRIKDV